MNLDIVGVSEVPWTGSRSIKTGDWIFFYSGGEKHESGVGVLLKEMEGAVAGCWYLSDKVVLLKVN